MNWLTKTLPPKIKREPGVQRRAALPEGLWSKCAACEEDHNKKAGSPAGRRGISLTPGGAAV